METTTPATWQLIRDFGQRRYSECESCRRRNLWELDYEDGKSNVILCTLCDVEDKRRGNTGSERVNEWLYQSL